MGRVGSERLRAAANVSTRSQRNSCQRGVENTCPAVILKNISFQNVTSGSLAFLAWHPHPPIRRFRGCPSPISQQTPSTSLNPPIPLSLQPWYPHARLTKTTDLPQPNAQPPKTVSAHTPRTGGAHTPPHRGCAHPKTLRNDN